MKFVIAFLFIAVILSGCQSTRTGNPVTSTGDFARTDSSTTVSVVSSANTGKENKSAAANLDRVDLTEPL